jgi:hypothetical protein
MRRYVNLFSKIHFCWLRLGGLKGEQRNLASIRSLFLGRFGGSAARLIPFGSFLMPGQAKGLGAAISQTHSL